MRVGRRLLEKGLHACRERLVRVVQQDVAARDCREHIGLCLRLGRHQLHRRCRNVLGEVQVGAVDARDVEQAAEVERSGKPVHLLICHIEFAHEQAEGDLVHVLGDLEADRRPEPATQQLLLERLDQVLGLVFVNLDVFVAGDPKHVVFENLHAGKEVAEVVGDEVFEGDESQMLDGFGAVNAHKSRQHRRHFEARELLLAGLRVAHANRQVDRQARDVGEWVRRIDGERHQHREDLVGEVGAQRLALPNAQGVPVDDLDSRVGQGRPNQVVKGAGVTVLQGVSGLRNVGEHVLGRAPHIGRHSQTGQDASLQAGDAHHEEFVEVVGEDSEKIGTFEHRQIGIFGEFEHPLVECQPAQLAVEVAVARQRGVARADERIEVVIEVAAEVADEVAAEVTVKGGLCLDVVAVHPSILAPPTKVSGSDR